MKTIYLAMAAAVLAVGISTDGEIWDREPPAPPAPAAVELGVPAPTLEPCAVFTFSHREVSTVDDKNGGVILRPVTDIESIVFVGDWGDHTIERGMVGPFLNYGFDGVGLLYEDMSLQSVDVSGLEEVTICLPAG